MIYSRTKFILQINRKDISQIDRGNHLVKSFKMHALQFNGCSKNIDKARTIKTREKRSKRSPMIINQGKECLLVIANSKVRPRHSRCAVEKSFSSPSIEKLFPTLPLCRCPGIQVSCAAGMFPLPEVPTLASASQESQPRPIRSQHLPT